MAIANRTTISWTDGANSITGTITDAPGEETVISETIPASSTDFLVNFTCDVSTLITLVMLASGGDMTVETNSSGAPAATIDLVDGVPLIWHNTGGYAALANSPFGSTDVTKLYITSTAGGTFKLAAGTDPTP